MIVGDAGMHPAELFEPNGSIDPWRGSATPGIEWLQRIETHFDRSVWINPEESRFWDNYHTTRTVRKIFPMYHLSIDGMGEAVQSSGRIPTVDSGTLFNPRTNRARKSGQVLGLDHKRWHQIDEASEGPNPDTLLDKVALYLAHHHRLAHFHHPDRPQNTHVGDSRRGAQRLEFGPQLGLDSADAILPWALLKQSQARDSGRTSQWIPHKRRAVHQLGMLALGNTRSNPPRRQSRC